MQKMRNPVHLDLNRNGDLLFYFLRGAAGPLGNYLHPGVSDIGVGFYRQAMERNNAPHENQKRDAQNHESVLQGKIDKRVNHYCSNEFWNSSAFATTCWPGPMPEMISCMLSGSMSPSTTSVRRN